jgi:hypothetical protein
VLNEARYLGIRAGTLDEYEDDRSTLHYDRSHPGLSALEHAAFDTAKAEDVAIPAFCRLQVRHGDGNVVDAHQVLG